MADIFSGAWAKNAQHVRAAGASSLKVKIASDAAYYNLGAPRDIKLSGKSLNKADSLLRPLPWGFRPELVVTTLQAETTEIKILDQLILNTLVGFQIAQLDNIYIVNESSPNLFSLHWMLKSSGDFDDMRQIEYRFMGNLQSSEFDDLFTATPVTVGTPGGGDVLATLSQSIVPAHQVPNGLSKIEFKASTDSAYADLGEFAKGAWSFECLTTPGGGGRGLPRTIAIKFMLDAHGIQTHTTETALLDDIQNNVIDLKLTNMDGMVITLPSTNFNLVPSWMNDGNADKERAIDFHAEGALVTNAAGTAYQTTGAVAWDSLFT